MNWRAVCAALLAAALTGCGLSHTVELEGFALWDKPKVDAEPLVVDASWVRKMGRGKPERYAKLRIERNGDTLLIADQDGWVTAYDTAHGKTRWVQHFPVSFRSGPHQVGDRIYLGTSGAEVFVLSKTDGRLAWRSRVSSEILSPPQANGEWVVVLTVDGRVYGLRARDGQRVWTYDRTVPVLSLRGTSTPLLLDDKVVVGFDNGKVVALVLADGKLAWEQTVATPQGRTELERMVDIDGDIVSDGKAIFVASYQGKIAALAADNGRVLWSREMSAFLGPVLVGAQLFVTDEKGVLWSLDRDSGTALWRQDLLKDRANTSPVWQDGVIAVGTRDGSVYWFNAADGSALGQFAYRQLAPKIQDDANIATTHDPFEPEDLAHVFQEYDVVASPVAEGQKLYIQYRNGVIAAVGVPKGIATTPGSR